MGFEPGEQAAGGEWQGKAVDKNAARRLTLALTLTPILSLVLALALARGPGPGPDPDPDPGPSPDPTPDPSPSPNPNSRLVRDGGYGGCMIWGANPSEVTTPWL